FNELVKSFDVLLKLARQKFSALRIKLLNVRDQGQQRAKDHDRENDKERGHRVLLPLRGFDDDFAFARPRSCVRSISAPGSLSCVRNLFSSLSMRPPSLS